MESLFADGISHVIDLAVAPVFLIAGISGALNVLSLRMGRIIDRGRKLNEQFDDSEKLDEESDREQLQLAIRAKLIHRAISLCTVSALFVCLVIVSLFVDVLLALGLQYFIAVLFVIALLCLIAGLLIFLKEISISATAFRFGRYNMNDQ
jgi:uncharacterized membrane protein YqjE